MPHSDWLHRKLSSEWKSLLPTGKRTQCKGMTRNRLALTLPAPHGHLQTLSLSSSHRHLRILVHPECDPEAKQIVGPCSSSDSHGTQRLEWHSLSLPLPVLPFSGLRLSDFSSRSQNDGSPASSSITLVHLHNAGVLSFSRYRLAIILGLGRGPPVTYWPHGHRTERSSSPGQSTDASDPGDFQMHDSMRPSQGGKKAEVIHRV